MGFLDKTRWGSDHYDSALKMASEVVALGEKNPEYLEIKLLTHWLCYIAERQTPSRRIWEDGGKVYSKIVCDYRRQFAGKTDINENEVAKWLKEQFKPNYEKSYLKYFKSPSQNRKLKNIEAASDENSEDAEAEEDNLYGYQFKYVDSQYGIIKFKPRFWNSDYVSIIYTLYALKDYKCSLITFIKETEKNTRDPKNYIRKMAYYLYKLTYSGFTEAKIDQIAGLSSTKSNNGIHKDWKRLFGNGDGDLLSISDRQIEFRNSISEGFDAGYQKFYCKDDSCKKNFENRKRVWCCVRDYVKTRTGYDYAISDKLYGFSRESLYEFLELPGDMWNNSSKFSECCFKAEFEKDRSDWKLARLLRKLKNDDKKKEIWGDNYPEQFDCTFDFVPRMCKRNLCEVCPFQLIKDNTDNKVNDLCVGPNVSKLCPVALVCCGYKIECNKMCKNGHCDIKDLINDTKKSKVPDAQPQQ